jgi:hypothetical protein
MYDVIKYLGIFLDSIKMEARLPRDMIVRIQQIIESFSMHNSCGRGPSSEHFWQVWPISAQRFQRRRFKCEKLTDGRTNDG